MTTDAGDPAAEAGSGVTPPRVVHVNDVAGVASAAVAEAAAEGLPWRLWPLPQVRGRWLGAKLWIRMRDVAHFRALGRSADIVHVHYGHFAYYAWSVRRPYLLHLHGTDVRVNVGSRGLGRLTRRAIHRAAAVVYSTPDMRDAVHALRPDATWLPAPLDPSVTAAEARYGPWQGPAEPSRPLIVFASRWDVVKGLDELLAAARALRLCYPEADLVGVDWGAGAADAAAAGVRLLSLLPAAEFRDLLAGADVVIGQLASGALGVADLTAMALGRPLVARFTEIEAYGGDAAPIWNTATTTPLEAVAEILNLAADGRDPDAAEAGDVPAGQEAVRQRCVAAADWARRHHGPGAFVTAATAIYRRVLGT